MSLMQPPNDSRNMKLSPDNSKMIMPNHIVPNVLRDGCRDTVEEEMFKTWSPGIIPQMPERRNDARRGERVPVCWHAGERVEADRKFRVGDIEIAHVMCAARRQCIDDSVGKVVMRIDHGNPVAGIDVVHGQVEQHGALPEPDLPTT